MGFLCVVDFQPGNASVCLGKSVFLAIEDLARVSVQAVPAYAVLRVAAILLESECAIRACEDVDTVIAMRIL